MFNLKKIICLTVLFAGVELQSTKTDESEKERNQRFVKERNQRFVNVRSLSKPPKKTDSSSFWHRACVATGVVVAVILGTLGASRLRRKKPVQKPRNDTTRTVKVKEIGGITPFPATPDAAPTPAPAPDRVGTTPVLAPDAAGVHVGTAPVPAAPDRVGTVPVAPGAAGVHVGTAPAPTPADSFLITRTILRVGDAASLLARRAMPWEIFRSRLE